ncbi:hypothetical protein BDR03DRAFT_643705 [Suillus americanus]|nr:hypothetical protein BDR03DRAFT_643705 [Suillus americanus]
MILPFLSHCKSWVEKVGRKLLWWRSHPSVATTGGSEIDPDNHLSDLTGFVSKESSHPMAHGSFGDVWKCTYIASNRQGSSQIYKDRCRRRRFQGQTHSKTLG